jgi:hypothetical protein
VLYLGPALAINAAIMAWLPVQRTFSAIALASAAAYGAAVLAATVTLSLVSWTDLERVLGGTMSGLWLSIAGVLALGLSAAGFLRQPLQR